MKDSNERDPSCRRVSRRAALGGLGGGLVAAVLTSETVEAAPLPWRSHKGPTASPVGRRGCTVTPLHSGPVLVAGGLQASPTGMAQIYDPQRGEWYDAAPMNRPRSHHAAVALNDGRVLVAGGRFVNVLSSAEIYDPRLDRWTVVAPMNTARAEHGAAAVNNAVLVTGGFNRAPLSSVELYDPFSDRWLVL